MSYSYDFLDGNWTDLDPQNVNTLTSTESYVYGAQSNSSFGSTWRDFGLNKRYTNNLEIDYSLKILGGGAPPRQHIFISNNMPHSSNYHINNNLAYLLQDVAVDIVKLTIDNGTDTPSTVNVATIYANAWFYASLIIEGSGTTRRLTEYIYYDANKTQLVSSASTGYMSNIQDMGMIGITNYGDMGGNDTSYFTTADISDTGTTPPTSNPSGNRLWGRPDSFGWIT